MSWWLDGSDFILVLGVCFSGVTGLLIGLCQSMRKSRCTSINCCYCIQCLRELESDDLVIKEIEQENIRERSNSLETQV